jgi:leucyl aminopeptidase
MQTRVLVGQPWDVAADVLAVPIPRDEQLPATVAAIDGRLEGELTAYRTLGELRGSPWSSVLLRSPGLAAPWTLAMGIGDAAAFDRLAAVRLGAAVERRLAERQVRTLAVVIPAELLGDDLDAAAGVELITRGVVEGSEDPRRIYEPEHAGPPALDELILVVAAGDAATLGAAAERGRIIGEGGNATRRLAQRSANDVSPEVLADEATALATRHGFQVEVLGPEQAEALGMGMFLAVGQGSSNKPRFIVLRNGQPGATDSRGRLLAMVGKGVCFDSGGISIKPADRMDEMKMDKTGACTVIAAMATIRQLAPDLPIMAVAPAVENMPGPHSTRPGDVIRAMNGKTVEVTNTDAEGRLILGDAFTWAERNGATHLVDVATLTGAVARALGDMVTGGFATPQSWWDEVAAAGARQGERYWQLPIIADYRSAMDSTYADLINSGTAEGSLVKSAVFLQEFVTRPWVHLDIAGTAYLRKAYPWAAKGATGVGHATLVELALAGASAS